MFLLCIEIFLVRIIDVSLGTIRTIFSVKGKNLIASIIGFIEVTVWFLIVKEALNSDNNSLWITLSYAGGFATGTYIGGVLSNSFINGNLGVQIIAENKDNKLANILRKEGYGVSVISVKGQSPDEKYLLFLEINNKSFEHLRNTIKKVDRNAFIIVNETKLVQNGYLKK